MKLKTEKLRSLKTMLMSLTVFLLAMTLSTGIYRWFFDEPGTWAAPSGGTGILSSAQKAVLTPEEQRYVYQASPVRMVVDPDWMPYAGIDADGTYRGISADLLKLVGDRTGLRFQLVPTRDWDESIAFSKDGKATLLSFLNSSPEREKWLDFTEPCFTDPNVIISRNEHSYVSDPSRLSGETVVLPSGTSIEERVRRDYPNLKVKVVASEKEALEAVAEGEADFTLRSLAVVAYVIRRDGLFNLKIAGEIPAYENRLRMGVLKGNPLLVSIMNKGIATITPQETEAVVNSHIAIEIKRPLNKRNFMLFAAIFSGVLAAVFLWIFQLRHLNRRLESKQRELENLSVRITEANQALSETARLDRMTGLYNRSYFEMQLAERAEEADRTGMPLSMIFFDLDRFKRINDTFGHNIGDDVLIQVCRTASGMVRSTDVLARWGGEEFVILLPGSGRETAAARAEEIRKALERDIHPVAGQVTISAGVAAYIRHEYTESWFRRVDRQLYLSKENGRNCVSVCDALCEDAGVQTRLVWQEAWACGHPVIDGQHEELLNAGNQLMEAVLREFSHDLLMSRLDTLLAMVAHHFQEEEHLIRKAGFPETEQHKALHEGLIDTAAGIRCKMEAGNITPAEAFRFIRNDIIQEHMLREDMLFFPWISRKSRAED